MKLSFVIPAYNEEKNIAKCLDSIMREKTGKNFDVEIIVVNNASTDKTGEAASSFPGVKVVFEPQKGILWARRAGFLASTGDLIANVDADTMLTPGWIDKVFYEFKKNPKLGALSGPFIYYDLSAWKRFLIKLYYIDGKILYFFTRFFFHTGAMLQGGNYVIKREILEKIGGYNMDIKFYGEDTDIARKVEKVAPIKFTFSLPILASGRRLAKEGIAKMAYLYGLNYFWIIMFNKPFTDDYDDIRK